MQAKENSSTEILVGMFNVWVLTKQPETNYLTSSRVGTTLEYSWAGIFIIKRPGPEFFVKAYLKTIIAQYSFIFF